MSAVAGSCEMSARDETENEETRHFRIVSKMLSKGNKVLSQIFSQECWTEDSDCDWTALDTNERKI